MVLHRSAVPAVMSIHCSPIRENTFCPISLGSIRFSIASTSFNVPSSLFRKALRQSGEAKNDKKPHRNLGAAFETQSYFLSKPNFLLKRLTRPPVSTIFCLPV